MLYREQRESVSVERNLVVERRSVWLCAKAAWSSNFPAQRSTVERDQWPRLDSAYNSKSRYTRSSIYREIGIELDLEVSFT
jgi:hypothetical protein